MTKYDVVYRNDDFPLGFDWQKADDVQSLFDTYNKMQTISVLTEELQKRPQAINWLKQNLHKVHVAFHGHQHVSYPDLTTAEVEDHLKRGLDFLFTEFKIMPLYWYLPWNGWTKESQFEGTERIKKIARNYGLIVDTSAVDIKSFIRDKQHYATVYFHAWDNQTYPLIEQMLQVDTDQI